MDPGETKRARGRWLPRRPKGKCPTRVLLRKDVAKYMPYTEIRTSTAHTAQTRAIKKRAVPNHGKAAM